VSTQLETIIAFGCDLGDTPCLLPQDSAMNLNSLKTLNLSYNDLDTVIELLSKLGIFSESLEELELSNCTLSNWTHLTPKLAQMTSLNHLDLSENKDVPLFSILANFNKMPEC
jgi:Leucine-rich repeat (LRR) protein